MLTSRSHAHRLKDAIKAIEAKVQLQCIAKGIQALESGVETIKEDGVEILRPLDKGRVLALSKASDARFKLLAKVMPDRKAVEMELGDQTLGVVREYSSVERAARLAFLLERIGAAGTGRATEGGNAYLDAFAGSAERRSTFLG